MITTRWRVSALICIGLAGAAGLSSCSAVGDATSNGEANASDDVGIVKAALDGCSTAQRNACAGVGTGCLNGQCQGGFVPVQYDGCSAEKRVECSNSNCGCRNNICGGGDACKDAQGNPIPVAPDTCTAQERTDCATFTCGCSNHACYENGCHLNSAGQWVPQDTPALPIPPVLARNEALSNSNLDVYDLTVQPGLTQIRTGAKTPIVGYNGMYPGPTIVARKNIPVQLRLTNAWSNPTAEDHHKVTLHNHGAKVDPTSDGNPMDLLAPGAPPKTYTYPNAQRASTYWYHDHTADKTASRVYNGLAGFYIVKDTAEPAELPSGIYDVPLLVSDKALNPDNTPTKINNKDVLLGNIGLVNGVSGAHLDVARHKYRFRILNGSSERFFNLAFTARTFTVIGSDGGLRAQPLNVSELSIAPGERYDIVVDFRQSTDTIGKTDYLKDKGGLNDLLEFRIKSDPGSDASSVPATLSQPGAFTLTEINDAYNRSFTFDSNSKILPGPRNLRFNFNVSQSAFMLNMGNDQGFNPGKINITSVVGVPYMWQLDNTQGGPHPFHKHLAPFQVIAIKDANDNVQAIPSEITGWKDTVTVPAGKKMLIMFKNETHKTHPDCKLATPGPNCIPYVFHCHILSHEDKSMMQQEIVVDP